MVNSLKKNPNNAIPQTTALQCLTFGFHFMPYLGRPTCSGRTYFIKVDIYIYLTLKWHASIQFFLRFLGEDFCLLLVKISQASL